MILCLVKQQTFCTVAGGMKCKREKPNMRNEWWFGIFFFLLDFLGLYNIILCFNERIITIFPILIWSNKCFPCYSFFYDIARWRMGKHSTKFHINLRKCPMRKVNIYMLKQSVDIGCACVCVCVWALFVTNKQFELSKMMVTSSYY